MRLPIRPLSGRWPAPLEKTFRRFFWRDPSVILEPDATPEQFRTAMSAIHVGETIKITGGDRHAVADDLLMDNLDLSDAVIVDIGASDGSTSVDLIRKLPAFREYIIADLYLSIRASRSGGRTFFFDNDGGCILVVGPRALAWPEQSRLVARLYARRIAQAERDGADEREVLLLGPDARALIAGDPRISSRQHDVFQPWDGHVDVIKVANLLRRLYFPDDVILTGLHAILAGLDDGGCFLVVDNSRIKDMPPRAGLYRRSGDRFETVAETENIPEIADLVAAVRLSDAEVATL